jgi:predicted RNA-binding Zn ribbon-like protein
VTAHPEKSSVHEHQASLEEALDFINTRELTRDGYVDHLVDLPTALRWLAERDLLHADTVADLASTYQEGPRAEGVLRRIRRLRESLREVLDATVERRLPSRAALAETNRALRARLVHQLVGAPNGVSLDHRHGGDPIDEALSRLAEPVAREVSGAAAERLRICANDECRWVFKDESPTGRRKWCSMAVCGNRAKVARHRERQRTQPSA